MDKPLSEMTVEELERAIEFHDQQYWILHKPVISDEQYDLLVRRLEALRPDSPVLRRVGEGVGVASFREKVTHTTPMLSLEKCYDGEKFRAWLKTTVGRTVRNLLQEGSSALDRGKYLAFSSVTTEEELLPLALQLDVVVTPKVDGVAASLRYDKNGRLALAATRGDGRVGEDFTFNARLISGIPWEVRGAAGEIEVRGEVYMKRSTFRAKYSDSFPNPRNLTAGSLKQKEGNRSQLLDLSFFAYDLLAPGIHSEQEKRSILERLGFTPVPGTVCQAKDVERVYEEAVRHRDEWDFDADGVVVRLDDVQLQAALGFTAHHPRGAIAYKFQGEEGITTLHDVEWSVSRSGIITPVAIVEPVFLAGARVSRSTLHNIGEFRKLNLHKGDSVLMARRGDVIPKVEENLGGGKEPFEIPQLCPSCGAPTLLAAPQLFVAGYRLPRGADMEQLTTLITYRRAAMKKLPLGSLEDKSNSQARMDGDARYRKVLTWGKGEREQREKVLRLLATLPGIRHKDAEVLVLAVIDPDVPASLVPLAMVLELVTAQKLDVRVLVAAASRQEAEAGPETCCLIDAARKGSFFHELNRILAMHGLSRSFPLTSFRSGSPDGSPGSEAGNHFTPLPNEEILTRPGDLSEVGIEGWANTAFELSDDVLYCSSPSTCRDSVLGTLEHFIQTLGVDGFGWKILERLYDTGLVRSPDQFFQLSPGDLVPLERMGETLATKLVENVQAARKVSLSTFLQALGVEELARHVSTLLEKEYGTLDRVLELTEPELMKHESIAFTIAHQVVHGLRRCRPLIERLLTYMEIEAPQEAVAGDTALPFSGLSFVFTGKMTSLQRKAAQELVMSLGGEAPDGVTRDLSYLVVGNEGSPLFGQGTKGNKLIKAERYNKQGASIKVISETEFLNMVRATAQKPEESEKLRKFGIET